MKRDMCQFLLLFVVILSNPCLFDSVHSLQLNSSTTTTTFSNCHPHQTSILLQLKTEFTFKRHEFSYYDEEVGKNTYPKMKYWKAGSDCCSWDGVSCDMATGHVISLNLCKSWLHGPLHSNSSLFRLLHLRNLNLAFNNFTSSPIPLKFGQLTRLTHLNLSNSMFSGHIPVSEISRLANLISLDLSFNGDIYFSSGIFLHMREGELGRLTQNMTNLRQLHLDWVDLSSRLPIHLAILSSFDTSPYRIAICMFIHLSDNNNLTGSLPEFPSTSMLKSLVLPNTTFSGKLPNSIGNLKFLNFLNLEMCSFSGIVPSSLGNLTELTYLDLTHNNFKGQLPYTVGNLAKLTEILLWANEFSGELPSSLGNLKRSKILDVGRNSFSGQIPLSLRNLTQLEVLKLSTNFFSGVIPSFLFKMPSLTDLYLDNNQFSGYLNIDRISNSSHLDSLYLSGNELSGQIPSSISKLTMLNRLYLDSNHLSGSLDFGIFSKLSHLQYLDLSNNPGLFITNSSRNSTLPKFVEVSLSSCNISEFPTFLKTQDELYILDLSNNRISDPIPKWLLSIGTIGVLNLSHNCIRGWEEAPNSPMEDNVFSRSTFQ
nr:receptor-like protein 6 [Ziziphus jujuba var. spinosa]